MLNNSQTVTSEYIALQGTGVISDAVAVILVPIIWYIMLPLNIIGIVTNIINIRVFVEQGVRDDSTNIGFVCLSISDLFGCATMIPPSICHITKSTNGLAPYYTCSAFATMIGYVHGKMQVATTWITVYISTMRSLAVLFPLSVKSIFTPKTTIVVMVLIFVISTILPIMYEAFTVVGWVFSQELNTTIAYVKDTPTSAAILPYQQLILNQISPVVAVVIVSINTTLMAKKLMEVRKWRLQNSSESSKDLKPDGFSDSKASKKPMASKDIELIKFINTATSIFLVCALMGLLPGIAVFALPGLNFHGINKNLFNIVFSARFFFDAVNSSINFFFYIRVSSRYKTAFASSCRKCWK